MLKKKFWVWYRGAGGGPGPGGARPVGRGRGPAGGGAPKFSRGGGPAGAGAFKVSRGEGPRQGKPRAPEDPDKKLKGFSTVRARLAHGWLGHSTCKTSPFLA